MIVYGKGTPIDPPVTLKGKTMNSDIVQKAIAAIEGSGDPLAVLKEWVAQLAGSTPDDDDQALDASASDDPGSEDDGAEGTAPPRKLSARQEQICRETGCNPDTFRALLNFKYVQPKK
jgi:hypothetical protein